MDAIACVAPHGLLSRSFADAAIARALHFSLFDCSSSSSPVFTEPTTTVADLGAAPSPMVAPPSLRREAPSSTRCRLGPVGGRAGKRRPRPSKRAPTTYISTDAATFRLMVQHVTGAEAEPQDIDAGTGLLLPPFDRAVEHMLPSSDPAAAAAAHVASYVLAPPAAPAAEQPCFPTLDSWNVMFEKNEVV